MFTDFVIKDILIEASTKSISTIWKIMIIVVPIMIVIRIAKELNLLDKVAAHFEPLTTKIFLPKEATFPLIVGMIFGLQFGAGVILQAVRDGQLRSRDLLLVNVFLGLCHGLIEDTFIFIALGANGWVVSFFRVLMALVTTYFFGRYLVSKYDSSLNEKLTTNSLF